MRDGARIAGERGNMSDIARITDGKTGRYSSWDTSGRNRDFWVLKPGEARVLADIRGPGRITHIWMTQRNHYRDCLLRMTWDDDGYPSVCVPLGDFFCLGHGFVNSFQSLLFSSSTTHNNSLERPCALNCYAPMPFRKRAVIELVNESAEEHLQYFHIDFEKGAVPDDAGYFHAEFRRTNPFRGWGPEIPVNNPCADAVNKERTAWEHNYVILQTEGRGHYIGCNLSVTNFQGTWWGEGDEMIWVDGYRWPPDIHGTGSEDYFNHAWGMQPLAYLRNGSSLHTDHTGGYQTSYVFHIENPVRFQKDIKVTIEHGHANHLGNEMASVAYWYAERPCPVAAPPPAEKRRPVLRDNSGRWLYNPLNQIPGKPVKLTQEMKRLKARWNAQQGGKR